MIYCIDANALINSWNEVYSIRILPSLWEKIAEHKTNLQIIKPIFDEIEPPTGNDKKALSLNNFQKNYPLRSWLEQNQFSNAPEIEEKDEKLALELRRKYQVMEKVVGIGTNDTLLIAYAKNRGYTVVTHEADQGQDPLKLQNYKIPLVCRKERIRCIKFPKLLEELKIQI